MGHGEFLNLWNEVAEARNNAVHGDPKFARTITPDLIHCMIYEGLEVFAKLNNRYTRSWKDNIVADRKKDLERLRRWNEDSTQAWD